MSSLIFQMDVICRMDMPFPLQKIPVILKNKELELWVPDPFKVRMQYGGQLAGGKTASPPFWSRVWPASIALAEYIMLKPDWIEGRRVLELAAGLGLPSLVAARRAESVLATDNQPQAVELLRYNASALRLDNFSAEVLDWSRLPSMVEADLVLMSDVNYEPSSFPGLLRAVESLLEQGIQILLSTPERLSARPFVESLAPYIIYAESKLVGEESTPVTILELASG
jgi:predicted nicotinamide N-methyase